MKTRNHLAGIALFAAVIAACLPACSEDEATETRQAAGLPAVTAMTRMLDGFLASVDGRLITRSDLDSRISIYDELYRDEVPNPDSRAYGRFESSVLQELIDEEIIVLEAKDANISVSDAEVDAAIEERAQAAGGEEQYVRDLKQRDSTIEQEEEQARKDLYFQKLYAKVISDSPKISDEDVLSFYNENQDEFNNPVETRQVRHILVDTKEEAEKVISRLSAGEDFAEVAREVSTDPVSAETGGDLGAVPSQDSGFVPEFEAAMNGLGAGQTSGIVKTQFGYHIIRVDSITPAGMTPFEECRDSIKEQLQQESDFSHFDEWLIAARSRHKVVYFKKEYEQGERPAA